jgi:hypothetical protein
MENIHSDIDFAGKLPKATDDFSQRDEWSLEALAYPVSHIGVIKFWALHPNTMEAYTLWWNGGSLHNFWTKYNSKVSEATSYEDYHLVNTGLQPCEVDRVKTYQKNRVKLVLSLLTIMDKCHAQHNDLLPSNIMLHFSPINWRTYTLECVTGAWPAALRKRKHHYMAIKRKKRWWQILHSRSMWHMSCSMFSGPRILGIPWKLCRRSTCTPRPRMHIQLACWQA